MTEKLFFYKDDSELALNVNGNEIFYSHLKTLRARKHQEIWLYATG